MNLWRYLTSFVYPYTIEQGRSAAHPFLEVAYENGRLVLNGERVNHSFGSLHQAFVEAFEHLRIKSRPIKNVLILGLGAGSLVRILEGFGGNYEITGVELDAETLRLAEKYFGLKASAKLNIEQAEATAFLTQNVETFDLIIVDLFIEEYPPAEAETPAFLANLQRALSPNGLVVYNRVVCDAATAARTAHFRQLFGVVFPNFKVFETMQNRMFWAEKK